ncbi:MAG: sigma 54-interacting transcriptional regulator [Planctomycetota bacterium]|jgi:DNA-binding NtrC family response regulator
MILDRIVAVSKDPQVQNLARQVCHKIFMADNLAESKDIIETIHPQLILLDYLSNNRDVEAFFKMTDNNPKNVPIVVICAENDTATTAHFKKMGTTACLNGMKDTQQLNEVSLKIKKQSSEPQENIKDFFVNEKASKAGIVGKSEAIQECVNMISLLAYSTCSPILIVGETGTGKELAAKAIHIIKHPNENFVAVNCAALTANLLESELFGHERGSFTGADREKIGLLELAGKGTIFLDEISEMPIDLQAKLLRVLQEKRFRRVGGTKEIACKATIVTTSNRNLYDETNSNRFRRDLFYRLNVCPIPIAPLRDPLRRSDITLLAEYFLQNSNICPEKQGEITSITSLAMEALDKHDWPGNVRELRNTIDRAVLLETVDKIGLSSIRLDIYVPNKVTPTTKVNCIKDFSLEKAERELIARALQETGWQKTRAAALLGITRATLYAKVKQYNITKEPVFSEDLLDSQNACLNKQPAAAH